MGGRKQREQAGAGKEAKPALHQPRKPPPLARLTSTQHDGAASSAQCPHPGTFHAQENLGGYFRSESHDWLLFMQGLGPQGRAKPMQSAVLLSPEVFAVSGPEMPSLHPIFAVFCFLSILLHLSILPFFCSLCISQRFVFYFIKVFKEPTYGTIKFIAFLPFYPIIMCHSLYLKCPQRPTY